MGNVTVTEKKCSKCNQIKPSCDFSLDRGRKSGLQPKCKKCKSIAKPKEQLPENHKKCPKCNTIKHISNFGKCSAKKDGLKSYCKNCRNLEGDSEKEKVRKQKWYFKNKGLTIDRAKFWVNNNKDKRRRIALKHIKQDIINNPHKYAWRSLLNNSLNRLGKPKEGHTIDLLGYSAVDLRQHLESLFTDGMSWDNYGEWHIDHIIGVINWDKDTHPSIVNSLSNLRPMWATTREINGIVYEGNLNRIKFH